MPLRAARPPSVFEDPHLLAAGRRVDADDGLGLVGIVGSLRSRVSLLDRHLHHDRVHVEPPTSVDARRPQQRDVVERLNGRRPARSKIDPRST